MISQKNSSPKLTGKDSIDDVIATMTLKEKVELILGSDSDSNSIGAVWTTNAITRLGIPSLNLVDGPQGIRIDPTRESDPKTYYATSFPIATSVSSSWDINVAEKVGQTMGKEAKEYGADMILGPALNIQRDPLNGRNFEYLSEDPLVSGKIAAGFVNGIQTNGVGAEIKHFALNNQETNRMDIDVIISQRALRENYLSAFDIAISESQPWSVMSSYNQLNGTATSQSSELLTDVLREDWNYHGVVTTDYGGGYDSVAQMKAQNDLIMTGDESHYNKIVNAVMTDKLDESVLDRNVRNILEFIIKTPTFKGYDYSNDPDLEQHAKVSRHAATQGMVLLKNDKKALPLDNQSSIGLFGTAQIETVKGGTGSGEVHSKDTVSIAEGLQNNEFKLNEGLLDSYSDYISQLRESDEYAPDESMGGTESLPSIPEKSISKSDAFDVASNTDVGIIVIGRQSGEGGDDTNEKGDFKLTEEEQNLISIVADQYHSQGKKINVVLNIGSPIETSSWRDEVDGILLAWQPGNQAGNAIADVLSGHINPSGKLPMTFPLEYNDTPSEINFPGTPADDPEKVVYAEDIYVGYRYNTTFNVETAYEFGFGLSYTTFNYSNVKVNETGNFKNKITVSATIENTGNVAGKEAAQVYLSTPESKLEQPKLKLVAFDKTNKLHPGERENLNFELDAKGIASFDAVLSAWVVEKGNYKVKVGSSSEDIRETVEFTVKDDILVEKVNNVLAPDNTAKSINTLIEDYEKKGDIMNHETTYHIDLHLKALNSFEQRGSAEKIIKRIKSLNMLLNQEYKNENISERAYQTLKEDADSMKLKWQWKLEH